MPLHDPVPVDETQNQPNPQALTGFKYSSLDPQARALVQQCTSEIKSLTKRSADDTIQIGQILILVKKRLKHGQWLEWLRAEFDWSEQAARQFIHVAQWAKSTKFVDLSFDSTALYRLAAPRTPEAARQEALYRARQGETITYSKAQTIIERHKHPPIMPEVLPPEQAIISTHQEVSAPSITITIPAKLAFSPKPSVEERALVEAQTGIDPQEPLNVNLKYQELPERVINENAEKAAASSTQAATRPQPELPIRLLSIDYNNSALQQNPLQTFKLTSADLHLHFESYLGDIIAWFQQQPPAFDQKAVREAKAIAVNGSFISSRSS